jgi:hypothetical protein
MTPREAMLLNIQTAFDSARRHSLVCPNCFSPIVKDEEGNPGLRSEACEAGRVLLDRWISFEKQYFTQFPMEVSQ